MAKKEKKIRESRLEDILWACREHLRGKADMSAKTRDLLARQRENAQRLESAFAALGIEWSADVKRNRGS